MTEALLVPRSVLRELQDHARQIEEIVATLEELGDKAGLRRIRAGLKEYRSDKYVVVKNPHEIRELLED